MFVELNQIEDNKNTETSWIPTTYTGYLSQIVFEVEKCPYVKSVAKIVREWQVNLTD